MYSCDRVGRSVTLSGIGLGLLQMTSDRRNQPRRWSSNAALHGMPTRFFSGRIPVLLSTMPACSAPTWLPLVKPLAFHLFSPRRPAGCVVYVSPRFNHSVPSSLSTLRTSSKTSARCEM